MSSSGVQLASGALGEQWGRRRTVQPAYLAYGTTSVLAALAPGFVLCPVARALQGTANAFTSPLLVAAVGAVGPAGSVCPAAARTLTRQP